MRDASTIWGYMGELYADIAADDSFDKLRPLLAHYTTALVLEQIAKYNELWFANPLFMNDLEEVRFGINEGTRAFLNSEVIRDAFDNAADANIFETALLDAHRIFDDHHAFDTYILCFCEHQGVNQDGLLSMWRGYGDSGRGAAIIFDAGELVGHDDSPLIFAKVQYATAEERFSWFSERAAQFAAVVKQRLVRGDEVVSAAHALFARLRLFSLFSKHVGFLEEQEWRLAYLPERDPQGHLKPYLGYHNGPRGIEPKLKLPVAPNPAFGDQPISLEKLVHSIILGPTASSPLARMSTKRMLQSLDRSELAERVVSSSIPYRNY